MSRYRNTMSELLKQVRGIKEQDEKDHEISMARGELEAIADKATQLSAALQGKSDEGNPLEAWVQSKITKAKDYINSVSDYLMYNPEQSNEEKECPPGMYYCKMSKTCKPLSMKKEELEEQATEKEIDKFHTDLDKLVHKSFGASSDEKKEKMDEKVADSIIKDLQKAYAPMKGKTISPEMANKMSKHLDQPSYDVDTLRQLVKANIPFISTLAKNKIYKKTGKFEEVVVEEKTDQEKISDLRTARSDVQNKINDMDRSDPKSKTPLTIAQNDLENINLKINQLSKKMQGESFSNALIQKASNRLTEKAYGWTLVSKAKDLAKKFANNMTKAVQEIEKLEKGLSDNSSVKDALQKANEEVHPHAKEMAKDGVSDEKIKKMHPEITADELKKLKESDAYDNQRYMMKKYMGQILAKPDNANTKDGKDHVYAPNAKIAKQLYSQGKKVYKEDSKELQKDKTDNYKDKNKEVIKEAKYQHKMYSKDGKEVEAKTPADHEKYAKMGYTHKNETHSFMTKDMNKSKKDAKGEKDIVDPKPKMSFKEAYKKAKKEAMNTVGDATADQANQLAGEGPKENDPDIKKPKAKADTGSKATPVDTSPEVEYKN